MRKIARQGNRGRRPGGCSIISTTGRPAMIGRLPVDEMWDVVQKAASAQGGQIPPLKEVVESARRTTPVYQKVADEVDTGAYKSADSALDALQNGLASGPR